MTLFTEIEQGVWDADLHNIQSSVAARQNHLDVWGVMEWVIDTSKEVTSRSTTDVALRAAYGAEINTTVKHRLEHSTHPVLLGALRGLLRQVYVDLLSVPDDRARLMVDSVFERAAMKEDHGTHQADAGVTAKG